MALISELTTGEWGFVDYESHGYNLGWESTFNRIGFGLGYGNGSSIYDAPYKESNSTNSQTYTITGFLRPRSMPKTRFFLQFNHNIFEYTKAATSDNNSTDNTVYFGVGESITAKVSGTAKFGYEWKKPEMGSGSNSQSYNIDLSYKFSPKMTYFITSSRGYQESAIRAQGISETNSFSLRSLYRLSRKINLDLTLFNFSRSKYQYGRDESYSWSGGLGYSFTKWARMNFGYTRSEKSSTNKDSEYTNNAYSVGMGVSF
jgi:hypothetical protein